MIFLSSLMYICMTRDLRYTCVTRDVITRVHPAIAAAVLTLSNGLSTCWEVMCVLHDCQPLMHSHAALQALALVGDFNSWDPQPEHWATKNDFGVWGLFLPDGADNTSVIPHRCTFPMSQHDLSPVYHIWHSTEQTAHGSCSRLLAWLWMIRLNCRMLWEAVAKAGHVMWGMSQQQHGAWHVSFCSAP